MQRELRPRLRDRFRFRIQQLFFYDTETLEILLATLAIVWGVVLLAPGETFQSSPGFRGMADLAVEEVWGCTMFAIGVSQWTAVFRGTAPLRKFAAFLGLSLWIFVAVMLFKTNPLATGPYVYGSFAMTSLFILVRLEVRP